jgi:chromate reductase, NAD(P)H dehydrogenase (quinone)
MNPLKISIISASPRKNSNSLRVAKRIKQMLESKNFQHLQLCNFENYDIPWVGQGDWDKDQLSDFQQKLIQTWASGELLIFIVPEYNWNTAPQLINAIDQLGGAPFDYLFDNKVFAFCGVSSGRGGRLPAIQMMTLFNKIISFTNKYAVVSPKIYESHDTAKNIDENGGSLGNVFYDKPLADFVDYAVQIAAKFRF